MTWSAWARPPTRITLLKRGRYFIVKMSYFDCPNQLTAKRALLRHAALVCSLLLAPCAQAADFVQDDWQGGAVSGSSTSLATGLTAYDSQDGNVVVLSTGIQIDQNVAGFWTQTNDGVDESGFKRPGSSLSSVTVSGASGAAFLHLVTETTTINSVMLPDSRGGLSAEYDPVSGDIFLFGGLVTGETLSSSDVFKFAPMTNSLTGPITSLWGGNGRSQMASAYHPGLNKFVLAFGGALMSNLNPWSDLRMLFDPLTNGFTTFGIPDLNGGGMLPGVYFPTDGLIYFFGQGNGTANIFPGMEEKIISFDAVSFATATMTAVLPSSRVATSAAYHPGTNKIYVFGGWDELGANLDEILEYDPIGDTLAVKSATLPSPRRFTSAIYYPPSGKILIFGGTDDSGAFDDVLEYDPGSDTLTVRPVKLPSPRSNMGATYAENRKIVYLFGGSSGPASGYDKIYEYWTASSDTYTSSVFETSNLAQFGAVSWSSSVPTATTLGVSLRTGNTPVPDGAWSNGGAFAGVTNGGSLGSFGPARYVQYAATFTTTDFSTSAVLHDLTISYTLTAPSATLISAAFDSGADSNQIQKFLWQGTFPADTTAQFQIRTASDSGTGFPATWSQWLGPTSSADFYTSPGGSDTINAAHKDLSDDRWLQYRAVLRSSNTLDTPTIATITATYNFLPSSPTLTSLVADSAVQLTAQWTDNAVNEDEFIISSGTTSGPTNTGAAAATSDKPGSGGSQSTPVDGLSPNTRYFVRMRAHVAPPDDFFSAFSNELSAFTLANPPASPAISAVFDSSLTLAWNDASNPGNTPYELSFSTDNFITHFSTPVPFSANLTATTTDLANLDPGTTYYLRLRAQNSDAINTAFTTVFATPTPPSPLSGLAGAALGVSSIAWTWDTSGPASRYRVYSASSGALLADLAATSFTQTGLSTNTAAGLQVEPYTGSASTGLSPPTTAFTNAAAPISAAIVAVGSDLVFISWDVNTNPSGTRFEVTTSTDGFTTHFSTPIPFALGLTVPTTSVIGLSEGTTHYFRVRAENEDSFSTAFGNTVSTITRPGTLGAPSGLGLGVSSISWSWSATAGPAVTSYDVFRASDGVLLGNVASTSFTETSLSTNTAYGIRVAALNVTGSGALSLATTAYTLAAAATGTTITAVYITSVTFTWSTNQNPLPATSYEIRHSTDGVLFQFDFTGAVGGGALQQSATAENLIGPVTHYFRVRAKNGDAVSTDFDVTVSTFVPGLPPLPAVGFTAEAVGGNRILLDWDISPTTTVVRYNLYFDNGTGAVDYAVLFASVTENTTSYMTAPLSQGVTYKFGLRAEDENNQEEKNTGVLASAVAEASLPGVRAAIRAPAGGRKITGDRVTLIAVITLGAPSSVKQVRFQYKASTASVWQDILPATPKHPNPDSAPPYFIHWDVNGLTATDYDLRALATDLADVTDGAAPSVAVTVNPADFDLREFDIGGGKIQKDQRIFNSITNTLQAGDPQTDLITTVVILDNALNTSTLTVTMVNNPTNTPPASADLHAIGIVTEITLSNAQTLLAGSRTATLTFTYADRNNDGIVDGTLVRVDDLAIYTYDAPTQKWRREFSSSVDVSNNTLGGATPHFSFFGLFAPAHADLGSVRVYPNPYKPNNSRSDDGAPFTSGDLNSGIVFDNLPDEATIKIYTVSAQLVREFTSAGTSGRLQWDVKNDRGQNLASGGYFAVITSPGQETVVRKIGIIR